MGGFGSTAEWNQETSGKEDNLRSPYLAEEFNKAKADGVLPDHAPAIGKWEIR